MIEFFPEYQITASAVRPTGSNVNGVWTPGADTDLGSFDCLYYKGGMAQALVSERIREKTEAVIIVEPSSTLQKGDKVTANSLTYRVIDVDNVAAAGEVEQIALELYS